MAHLDFETYSPINLIEAGMFKYSEHPDAEILIISYELNDGTKDTVHYKKPSQLKPLFRAIRNGEIVTAHNSQFERCMWENVGILKYGWPIEPKSLQWDCTAARAAALSLPRSLLGASLALRLPVTKDPKGKALIDKFCKPPRTMPEEDPEAFKEFMQYCRQDVIVEKALDEILPPLTRFEHKIFALDYRINKRGVPVDVDKIEDALNLIAQQTELLVKRCVKATGVRPSQRDKFLQWVKEHGVKVDDLQQATVERILPEVPHAVASLLRGRLEVAKAGTKKLKRMITCASSDGRIRGGFWYHSASTGRWGSGGVQLHNLSKPGQGIDQDEVLEYLDHLEILYPAPLTVLAGCVRGFLSPGGDDNFMVGDYSAIEARVLAWLAQEEWLVQDFRDGKDAYKTMAGKIYNKPYEEIDGNERFFGKQTVLGCGFGMGAPKFQGTCARFGVEIDAATARDVVKKYRDSTPKISRFRRECEYRAKKCVMTGQKEVFSCGRHSFELKKLSNGIKILYWNLPGGRRMAYPEPRIEVLEKWGKQVDTLIFKTYYRGMWVDEETYSGKLSENITQAVSRDLLCEGMMSLERKGYEIVLHVHDEAGSINSGDVTEFEDLMCKVRPWAKGLPLKVEAKTLHRYAK